MHTKAIELLLIALTAAFFSSAAFSSPNGASIEVPKLFLSCAEDSDCIAIENDCAHCCGHGTAVNRKHQKDFVDLIKANCATYKGGVCDCEPDRKKKWDPKCIKGNCEIKAVSVP